MGVSSSGYLIPTSSFSMPAFAYDASDTIIVAHRSADSDRGHTDRRQDERRCVDANNKVVPCPDGERGQVRHGKPENPDHTYYRMQKFMGGHN